VIPILARAARDRSSACAFVAILLVFAGCTDVGDTTPGTPTDSGGGSDVTVNEGSAGDDAGDANEPETSMEASSPADAGGDDSTVEDASRGSETGAPDAGGHETGGEDAGPDATLDGGPPDAGAPDTGGPDTGLPELDAATEAASPDTGGGGGGGLVPCTSAAQTGCVGCYGSTGNVCTATEASFLALDIAAGRITMAGAAPDDSEDGPVSCYSCLVDFGCLDSPSGHVTGKECEDLTGNFTNGSGASVPAAATCEAVVSCITGPTGQGCAANSQGINYCYCGSGGGPSSQCEGTNASMVNGACIDPIVAGTSYAKTDAANILSFYGAKTTPSGVANNIFTCAVSNVCTACL
jgi:hypothetical protein